MIYESKYRIGLTDVGKSNKITNKAIIKILENVAGMHSEATGCGINQIEQTKLSWILLSWKVKIFKRPLYNEEITARTWARDTNKVTTYRDYEIYNQDKELIAIATSKWTLINIDTKQLATIPQTWVEVYKPEEISVFEEKSIGKLKEADRYISKIDYKVLRSDIDINEHVHNLYYLDFAYEALPEEVYKADECNNIEIMYKKQIKLTDEIVCLYAKVEDKNVIAIKSKDETILHAIINLY